MIRIVCRLFAKLSHLSLAIVIAALAVPAAIGAQTNEWAWISGSSSIPIGLWGQPGAYGTRGTPAAGNVPGGRNGGCGWDDQSGNLWLFGGIGLDAAGTQGYLNDLWRFNPTTSQWTWMSGGSSVPASYKGNSGVYGKLNSPAQSSVPGGRSEAGCGTDNQGNFWLFGGEGFDSGGAFGYLNDLWKFNPATNQWTWMSGSSTVSSQQGGIAGVYGTMGMPAAGNSPGGRLGAAAWTDGSGNLRLFGGYGYDANDIVGNLNDFWQFNTSTGEWTWIGGTNALTPPWDIVSGVYGTQGSPAEGNIPGARSSSVTWTDTSGNLWLFGGLGNDAVGAYGWMNDMWEFQPSANEWTWVSGSSTLLDVGPNGFLGRLGIYGAMGIAGDGNTPGGRDYAVSWTDSSGNLWLMGGWGVDSRGVWGTLNDLWEYQIPIGEWTWIGGSETLPGQSGNIAGIYGTIGAAAQGNFPGSRIIGTSWTDRSGDLWLFAGNGADSNDQWGSLNDLWEYKPGSPAGLPLVDAPIFSPAPGTYTTIQSISITDATQGATITYSINGGLAVPYTGPITLSSSATISAVAQEAGYTSNSTSAVFTVNLPPIAIPVFSVAPGTYPTAQTVTLSDATAGATIYYSTSGVATTSSQVYTGPLSVAASETIQAIAAETGYATSAPAVAQYVIWPSSALSEWAWISGSDSNDQFSTYGVEGLAAPGNTPGSRYLAATWTDGTGNLWLFGGGLGELGSNQYLFNDMWQYSTSTHEWIWMGGNSVPNQQGNYGTKGKAWSGNNPGARDGAAFWKDANGHFWLFGGEGYDTNRTDGLLDDLWEYDPSTNLWTWVSGNTLVGSHLAQPGVFGTLGMAAPGNVPGGKEQSVGWADKSGHFWIFGGFGVDSAGDVGAFNDFWEFDPSTKEWTWMGGNTTACVYGAQSGVFGTRGTPATQNIPGCKYGSSGWTDMNGNLWLFGGEGRDIQGYWGDHNDYWVFHPSTKQWAWMGGQTTINLPSGVPTGQFGTLGTAAAGNVPSGRHSANIWTGATGDLWLLGGLVNGFEGDSGWSQLNDLWKFTPSSNLWAWMGGSDKLSEGGIGVYGTLGTPAPGNVPGARWGGAGWTDLTGNFWLFGGEGFANSLLNPDLGDLWEYLPSTAPLPVTTQPVFSPASGDYSTAQTVSISDATNGATLYYTTDGSTPTESLVVNPGVAITIKVPYSETVKAFAMASGCEPSPVATATYTLSTTVATPTFSVPSGSYNAVQQVTISDATPGVDIFYTTDGTNPTTSSPGFAYTVTPPIPIAATETLKAIAVAPGYTAASAGASAIASASYVINLPQAAAPVFSLASGTYASPQTVSITSQTAGSTIYYTTNGTTPTTSSTEYTSAITVSTSETLEAIAVLAGDANSAVAAASYAITVPAPTFSPGAGTYTVAQNITVADPATGATIYYTTDGSAPTTGSTKYSAAIPVAASETINAIAVAPGYAQSQIATAAYTINLPPAAAPVFKPTAGTYTSAQTITLSCATNGATFFYTTDGTTPAASSPKYTSAGIKVSTSQTIEAIAVANGFSYSPVALATYAIQLPQTINFAQPKSPVAYGVSPMTLSATGSASGNPVTFSVVSGPGSISGNTLTITGAGTIVVAANQAGNGTYGPAPQVTHSIVVNKAAQTITFTAPPSSVAYGAEPITLTATANSGLAVAFTVKGPATLNGNALAIMGAGAVTVIASQTGNGNYNAATAVTKTIAVTKAPLTVTAASVSVPYNQTIPKLTYTVTGNVNGDGSSVVSGAPTETTTAKQGSAVGSYPITLAQGTLAAANYGFSLVNGTVAITALGTTAAPSFTPAAGTYTSAQTVTLTSTTSGAVIYYTTNGSTPSTSSTKYAAPGIKVTATETVNAIAVAPGYAQSGVATAAYVIATAPVVITSAAANLSSSGATLNGTVNPENSTTQYWFAYGTSKTALSSTTAAATGLTGATAIPVTAVLTGLNTKTTYYFQVVAQNAVGKTPGSVLSFTAK